MAILRRIGRWLRGAIENAAVMVGASRSVEHSDMSPGSHEQFLATSLGIDQSRRRGDAEALPASDRDGDRV